MSARWWKPWTWSRREDAGVRHLTDLVDPFAWQKNPVAALDAAALLARRAGVVFAPEVLTLEEVEALARARELLELERAAVTESLLRDLFARLVLEAKGPPEDPEVARLERAVERHRRAA